MAFLEDGIDLILKEFSEYILTQIKDSDLKKGKALSQSFSETNLIKDFSKWPKKNRQALLKMPSKEDVLTFITGIYDAFAEVSPTAIV